MKKINFMIDYCDIYLLPASFLLFSVRSFFSCNTLCATSLDIVKSVSFSRSKTVSLPNLFKFQQ